MDADSTAPEGASEIVPGKAGFAALGARLGPERLIPAQCSRGKPVEAVQRIDFKDSVSRTLPAGKGKAR